MLTLRTRSSLLVSLILSTPLVGCDEESDRVSELDSLRIVAVRADSPFAKPESEVELEMLVEDASPRAVDVSGTPRAVSTLWLGSCVNPAGDLYYNCLPGLHESLSEVTDDELAAAVDTDATQAAKLGFGANYSLAVPSDIVSSRTPSAGIVHPYGVAFVFYAACAGQLRVERGANPNEDYPVGCYDATTGEALGQADFEFGYYPVYAYEELTNDNPVIEAVEFSAATADAECNTDAECPAAETCGASGRCIARVTACDTEKGCSEVTFLPTVSEASAEVATSAYLGEEQAPRETVWVSYYADLGTFDKDSRVIYESATGMRDDYAGAWKAVVDVDSVSLPREVHLYAVVRDSRGGVSWVTREVYIE